uniref:Uncharacterized protein n=1 Tax=Daucus carota subsp. sativus TaxID=79200 RepID=A0A175YLG6_DAUCS
MLGNSRQISTETHFVPDFQDSECHYRCRRFSSSSKARRQKVVHLPPRRYINMAYEPQSH